MTELVFDVEVRRITDKDRRNAALTVTDRFSAEESIPVLLALKLITRVDGGHYTLVAEDWPVSAIQRIS